MTVMRIRGKTHLLLGLQVTFKAAERQSLSQHCVCEEAPAL